MSMFILPLIKDLHCNDIDVWDGRAGNLFYDKNSFVNMSDLYCLVYTLF